MKRKLSLWLIVLLCIRSLFVLAEPTAVNQTDEENQDVQVVTSELRALKLNDSGEDVKRFQIRLRELYYYKGPVSGKYLDATQKAVKDIQAAYDLKQTGVADKDLLELVYGECYRSITSGTQGSDVKRLQTRLSELGYYNGKISGNFLEGSSAAISRFQRDNGLIETGNADIKTQIKLFSDDISAPSAAPDATPAPPQETNLTGTPFKSTLGYGSKSDQVKLLQNRLTELKFFTRKASGGFYQYTKDAVVKFQKMNGLNPDGSVGKDTWDAMFASDAVPANGVAKPTPVPTPVPYFAEVDVTNQLIKIYTPDEQGGYTKLEHVFICSTGTKAFPSTVGTFTLTGRRAQWAEFPNWGGGKARYWVRITPDIAFHSVIYNSNNTDDVSMKAVKKLGSRASHGCIRLTVVDARWIYQNLRAGVQVYIHEDGPEDPELKAAHKPGAFNDKTKLHYVTPAPTAEPVYDPAKPPEAVNPMKVGTQGADVYWLQMRLKELGYYKGSVTGSYLGGTKQAVIEYQKDHQLPADGLAGKNTLEKIYQDARTIFETPLPEATPQAPTPSLAPTPSMSASPIPTASPSPSPVFTVEEKK